MRAVQSPTRRRAIMALPLLLAACAAPGPPVAEVPLPGATAGLADPGRGAVLSAAWAFSHPDQLRGRPAETARALARLEWMAETLPRDPRWTTAAATLPGELAAARAEARHAFGLDPAATPAGLAGALIAAGAALDQGGAGAAKALAPVAPGGGQAALARLAAPPLLPRAVAATAHAQAEMLRLMKDDPGDG
jgi:hypothetical protein